MIFTVLVALVGGVILRDTYYLLSYLASLRKKYPKKSYHEKYTIIIPHYDEDELTNCLEAVYPDNIVVVDDGSQKKNQLKKWEDKITVYYLPHRGKYHALNYGIDHSSGDIVILDSDTFISRGSLEKLLSSLEDFDAVSGNIQVQKEKGFVSRAQAIEHLRIAMFRRIERFRGRVDFIPGPFAAFKRQIFDHHRFRPSKVEDFAFSETIRGHAAITYEPEAVAYTTMPGTLRSLYNQRIHWARGNIEELTMRRIFPSYLLSILDILVLVLSLLTWSFLPLLFFLVFESATMTLANRVERGNCLYESLLFPFFMYFLAFFYLIVYGAAFIEMSRSE